MLQQKKSMTIKNNESIQSNIKDLKYFFDNKIKMNFRTIFLEKRKKFLLFVELYNSRRFLCFIETKFNKISSRISNDVFFMFNFSKIIRDIFSENIFRIF